MKAYLDVCGSAERRTPSYDRLYHVPPQEEICRNDADTAFKDTQRHQLNALF